MGASSDIKLHWREWDRLPLPDGLQIWDPDGFRFGKPEVVTFDEFLRARSMCTIGPRNERQARDTYLWVMLFDDGHSESIWAPSQAEAVSRRMNGRMAPLPHTVNNLTILDWWRDRIDRNKGY